GRGVRRTGPLRCGDRDPAIPVLSRPEHFAHARSLRGCSCIFARTGWPEDVRRSVISAFAELDRPRSPGEASLKATLAILAGDTHKMRQQFRDSLLGTSRADFLQLSDLMEVQEKRVAILGSRESLEAALRQRPGIFTLAKPIG